MNVLKIGIADSNKDAQKSAQTKQKSSAWDCESSLYDSFELRTFIAQLNQALAEVSSSTPYGSPQAAAGCIRSFSTRRTAGPRFVTDSLHCNIHNTVIGENAAGCSDFSGGILSRPVKKLLMRVFHRKTVQHRGRGIETGEVCRCHQADVQSNFVLRKCASERFSSQAFDGLRGKK